MKRIIDGVTFNTDTSTKLGLSEYSTSYNHEEVDCSGVLYQTRGGAFFLVEDIERRDEDGYNIVKHRFSPKTRKEAQDWMMTGEVEVFSNPFDDPPEAVAEEEAGATIYLRIPKILKNSLEDAAKADSISLNSWAMRCLERCLQAHKLKAGPFGSPLWTD